MQDAVIKYQTVRLDEDLKRQKKYVHKREVPRAVARRPRRTPAPQSAPPAQAPPPSAAPESAPAS